MELSRTHPRPIAIDIHDPDLLDEARLVASVTGRQVVILSSPDATGDPALSSAARAGLILLTDHDGELERIPGVECIRVDALSDTTELARRIGRVDPLRVAVIGAAGGAGATIYSAALSADLARSLHRDVVLVDRDPFSTGAATVLGIENQPGWRSDDITLDETAVLDNCPTLGDISVLSRTGLSAALLTRADSDEPTVEQLAYTVRQAILVVDCGRCVPDSQEWEEQWGHVRPDAVVVMSPLTVAGISAARDIAYIVDDSGLGQPLHVVRRIPQAATTVAMAMTLLGCAPTAVLSHSELLAADLDRGALNLRERGLVKAAQHATAEILRRWQGQREPLTVVA